MVELKLQIGEITFVDTTYTDYLYAGKPIKDTSIVYTNKSTDYWNSSYDVDCSIDEKQAKDIIEFLQKAFDL